MRYTQKNTRVSGEFELKLDARGKPTMFASLHPEGDFEYNYTVLTGAIPGVPLDEDELFRVDAGVEYNNSTIIRVDVAGGVVVLRGDTGSSDNYLKVKVITH